MKRGGVAIVTGGASGIGRATAEGLARDGARPQGMGLIGIRERALALGGRLVLQSRQGTELRVELPLPPED